MAVVELAPLAFEVPDFLLPEHRVAVTAELERLADDMKRISLAGKRPSSAGYASLAAHVLRKYIDASAALQRPWPTDPKYADKLTALRSRRRKLVAQMRRGVKAVS